MRARTIFILIAWIIAFVVACLLDAPAARYMHDSGVANYLKMADRLAAVLKTPGEYWFAVLLAAVVFVTRKYDWKSSLFILFATGISGVNGLVKWIAGRTRPYKIFDSTGEAILAPFRLEPFRGGLHGMFQSKNLCFPSGHACLAFAAAESMAILFPRGRWAFRGIASITAMERIAENAHYVSDCVGAAALAIAGVHLIHWLWFRILLKRIEKTANESPTLAATSSAETK